ncbi:MAG: hypothetical protein ABJM06_14675 [Gilvibacter sp.]
MKKGTLLIGIALLATAFGVYILLQNNNGHNIKAVALNSSTEVITEAKADDKSVPTNITFEKGAFFYGIGTRFNSITKEQLLAARSFSDFIGDEHDQRIISYSALNVIILEDSEKTNLRVDGKGGDFTQAQLDFIKTLEYSTNLLVWAEYKEDSPWSGKIEESHWTPYLTIVPEQQATYSDGKNALIAYLMTNSKQAIDELSSNDYKPGKMYFTITKEGRLENVKTQSGSGYSDIDALLEKLLKDAPGSWQPATDSEGNKVAQELVFSFGNMGC